MRHPRRARRTPPLRPLPNAPGSQRRWWPAAAVAGLLVASHAAPSPAALRQWSGAGGIPDWSKPGNWSGGVVPVDGDEVLFGAFTLGSVQRATRDDVSPLNLDLIAFTADAAPYSINVFEELTLSGIGIVNASASTHTMLIGNSTFGDVVASFAGTATASNLRIETEGALLTSPPGSLSFNIPGHLSFLDASTAASATIVNGGAGFAGGSSIFFKGGLTEFSNTSTAGSAAITNVGGTSGRASGGLTRFLNTSTAGNATIFNDGGTADGSGGGTTEFFNSSTAATAHINNRAGTSGAPGGITEFRTASTAADAVITNVGATNSSLDGFGSTLFSTRATAGRATITNQAGTANGAEGGLTTFINSSVAGTATITNRAGTAVGAQGGLTVFGGEGADQTCSADAARITNDGGSVPNLSGVFAGRTLFDFSSTAGSATIVNSGGSTNLGIGGQTDFDGSDAGAANITNKPGLVSGARGGRTSFFEGTAANATITNEAAAVAGASPGFTSFVNARTMAATLVNKGAAVGGANAGRTDFSGSSIAGNPTITNEAGTANGAFAGRTIFRESATAGAANISNNGSPVVGGEAGTTEFSGTASAGNSTITNGAGAAGAAGGLTLFLGEATGGTARAITNGSGRFDISGLTTAGMAVGSIEGSGNYFLGGKNLAVGGNGLNTAVSGVVQDGGISGGTGGSLTKVGLGTLTLSGDNTYGGGTTVNAGTLRVSRMHEKSAVNVTGGKLQVMDSAPSLPFHPAGNNAFVSRPDGLAIANDGAELGKRVFNGQVDLTNNDLILDYSGVSPIADIEDMIRAGYNRGDWLGNGITSSTANANRNFALAVADNFRLALRFGRGRLFSGREVDTTTILVKFTHRIDLDLDGVVTTNDATIFNSNYSEGAPAYWSIGDLDYDRVFTTNDATLFNGFYSEALASVPEPATLAVLALAGADVLGRRRRWTRAM